MATLSATMANENGIFLLINGLIAAIENYRLEVSAETYILDILLNNQNTPLTKFGFPSSNWS
jgi:hypothetical protein